MDHLQRAGWTSFWTSVRSGVPIAWLCEHEHEHKLRKRQQLAAPGSHRSNRADLTAVRVWSTGTEVSPPWTLERRSTCDDAVQLTSHPDSGITDRLTNSTRATSDNSPT